MAVYIGLLLFLLGIGGYLYSQAGNREAPKDAKEYPQQVMSSWKPSEEIDPSRSVKPDRNASAVSESQAQAAESVILRAFPPSAEKATGEVAFKEDISEEKKQSFDKQESSSSSDKEADLADSVVNAQTSQIEDSSRKESPDSTEVIDWLLEKRSKAKGQ